MKSKCTSIVSIIELQINVQKKSQDKSNVIEAKESLENYTYSVYIYIYIYIYKLYIIYYIYTRVDRDRN